MPDREKVIKGLECCQYSSKSHCDGCPYLYEGMCGINGCTSDLAIETLALMKEQEADIKNLNETIANLLQKITEMKMIYGDCEYVGELVRCKDCQFHYAGENEADAWDRCRLHSINTESDNYCSWAVKNGK